MKVGDVVVQLMVNVLWTLLLTCGTYTPGAVAKNVVKRSSDRLDRLHALERMLRAMDVDGELPPGGQGRIGADPAPISGNTIDKKSILDLVRRLLDANKNTDTFTNGGRSPNKQEYIDRSYRGLSVMQDYQTEYTYFYTLMNPFMTSLAGKLKPDAPSTFKYVKVIPLILPADDPDFAHNNLANVADKSDYVLAVTVEVLSKFLPYVDDMETGWFRVERRKLGREMSLLRIPLMKLKTERLTQQGGGGTQQTSDLAGIGGPVQDTSNYYSLVSQVEELKKTLKSLPSA